METKIEELEKKLESLETEEAKEIKEVKEEKPKPIEKPKKVERTRKSVIGAGKALNKEPFSGVEREKQVLMTLGRVCYNCIHEKDGRCKIFEFEVRPDQHCFKYEKGVRIDGRSRF